MPYATQPNVTLTTDWTTVATGASEVYIQNIGTDDVIVATGSSTPAAGSSNGKVVRRFGTYSFTGGTTETVYARASSLGSVITVDKL